MLHQDIRLCNLQDMAAKKYNTLIIKKPNDQECLDTLIHVIKILQLNKSNTNLKIFLERRVVEELEPYMNNSNQTIDQGSICGPCIAIFEEFQQFQLIITIGGDGTVLYAVNLIQKEAYKQNMLLNLQNINLDLQKPINGDISHLLNNKDQNNSSIIQQVQVLDSITDIIKNIFITDKSEMVNRTTIINNYQQIELPPILAISKGTLGFMCNYDINKSLQQVDRVLDNKDLIEFELKDMIRGKLFKNSNSQNSILNGNSHDLSYSQDLIRRLNINEQSQIAKEISQNIEKFIQFDSLNEITIDRGGNPTCTVLEIYLQNQLLTTTLGDGIIICTPNGSTAYSLSAGGPIVHPSVQCLMIVPICPHSLSFRPIILPINSEIKIKIPQSSRSQAYIRCDGRNISTFSKEDELIICFSPQKTRIIMNENESDYENWIIKLKKLLNWNATFTKL